MADRLLRETKPGPGYLPEIIPGQYWDQTANEGVGGYEKIQGSGGASKVLLWGPDGSALMTTEKPGYVDVVDRAGRSLGVVSATNLDIALSVLRDAIAGTGAGAKTQADIVTSLSAILAKVITAPATEAKQDALAALMGPLNAAAVIDPTLSASEIALLKGILKQLQGTGAGALPTTLTGSNVGKAVSASTTRPNNNTPYTALSVVSTEAGAVMEFAGVGEVSDTVAILTAKMRIDVVSIPAGMAGFRLHLYNAAPTAIANNAAYNLPSGDRDKYLGYVQLNTVLDLGDTLWVQSESVNLAVKLAGTALYGILQTLGAFTPTANVVKTVTLNTVAI